MGRFYAGMGVAACAVVFGGAFVAPAEARERVDAGTLQAEGQRNPIGLGERQPMLSWELDGSGRQTAYQVRAATSEAALRADRANLWDSGRIESRRSSGVAYGGDGLDARDRVFWQVRVWDGDGVVGPWSTPAHFEMGLLDASDWSASWIENPSYDYFAADGAPSPLPVFGTSFTPKGRVARARLYMTGLGMYEAKINGQPVSTAVLEPGQTDYADRVAYRTYDVTDRVRSGPNALGIETGSGVYQTVTTPGRFNYNSQLHEPHPTYGEPKAIAQLELTYEDGSTETIGSDASWRTRLGATTVSTWWGGETFDARRLRRDWTAHPEELTSGDWQAAAPVTLTSSTTPTSTTPLVADPRPPIEVVDRVAPTSVAKQSDGSYVFDFGAHRAGWAALRVRGAAGTTIKVTIAEELRPDGTLDLMAPSRGKEPISYSYTLSGDGEETWRPQFTYNSFRYVQVEGLEDAPRPDTVTQEVAHATNARASTFTSSDETLDRIRSLTLRAIENNMHSVLTDTPNREKGPYTGDTLHNIDALLTDYAMPSYMQQHVQNWADAQRKAGDQSPGLIANIAPEFHRNRPIVIPGANGPTTYLDEVNWGGAIVRVPWKLYEIYGDTRTLRRFYPNMVAWMDYVARSKAKGDLPGLGDWLGADQTTPKQLTILYGYHRAAEQMAKIADLLGDDADVLRYEALTRRLRDEFNARYRVQTADGVTYGTGSQAGLAVALEGGLVPEEDRPAVLASLVERIQADGYHITVGSPSLASLFKALHDGGRDDVLLRMVTNPTAPSYAAFLSNGFTALPESFGAYKNDPDSKGHHYLGQVDNWLITAVAGIDQAPASTGFDRLRIKPTLTDELRSATGTYRTPHGVARSAWQRDGDTLRMTVTVPANSDAEIWVPVREGQRAELRGDTVTDARDEAGYRVYRVGAGSYEATAAGAPAPPVTPPATPPTGPPTTPAAPSKPPTGKPLRLSATKRVRDVTLRRSGVLATVDVRGATRLTVRLERGSRVLGSSTRTARKAGRYRVRVRLNAAGRRAVHALRPGRSLKIKLVGRARVDGRQRVVKQLLTIKG